MAWIWMWVLDPHNQGSGARVLGRAITRVPCAPRPGHSLVPVSGCPRMPGGSELGQEGLQPAQGFGHPIRYLVFLCWSHAGSCVLSLFHTARQAMTEESCTVGTDMSTDAAGVEVPALIKTMQSFLLQP